MTKKIRDKLNNVTDVVNIDDLLKRDRGILDTQCLERHYSAICCQN